ncbi:MAG TPA: hypothetical protein VK734_07865 [Bradyrhizobium sp.]|nr:hypothetical protein [Bradyrhizobium sp.]
MKEANEDVENDFQQRQDGQHGEHPLRLTVPLHRDPAHLGIRAGHFQCFETAPSAAILDRPIAMAENYCHVQAGEYEGQ